MLPFFIPSGKLIIPSFLKAFRQRPTPYCLAFLKVYFAFTYFLCFSPFLIQYNHRSATYEIYKAKYHQMICGILHFFTLFQYLSYFRHMQLETLHNNPDNYFEFANVVGSLAYFLTLFWALWRKQNELLNIFKLVEVEFGNDEEIRSRSVEIKRHAVPVILCCTFMSLTIFSVVIGNVAVNKWKFLGIPKSYYSRADFVYLFEATFGDSPPPVSLESPGLVLTLTTTWYIFIEVYIWIGSHFTDLLFLISALFLRLLVRDFCNSLHKRGTTVYQGVHNYFALRKIVDHLNTALGPIILSIILTGLPYHSSNVELVFSHVELARRLRVLFAWCVFVSSLVTAASANNQLQEVKEWLLRDGNAASISQSTLIIVSQELKHVGLKGWGFYTITFGFLGKVLSVVLTYAILIVQLHSTTGNYNISNQ